MNLVTVDPTPSPFVGAAGLVGLEHHLEAGRLEELHAAAGVHRRRDLLVAQPQPPAPVTLGSSAFHRGRPGADTEKVVLAMLSAQFSAHGDLGSAYQG